MLQRAVANLAILAALLATSPAFATQQSAINKVKMQPRVLGVEPDNAGNLWIAVLPDASINWSMYAQQMCRIVQPEHARIFLVKVVDINSTHQSKNPRQWKMLGGANCMG